jgi:mannose-6-phosphate isomerase-like protein (cupin superfamily)
MQYPIRRVVTGHNTSGKAVVLIDEISTNTMSRRPGQTGCVVWSTEGFPANNDGDTDESLRSVTTGLPNGTICRINKFDPGVSPRMHRTDTIDYAIVMSGAIDMEMDDGAVVHLKAGDVLVQRGTVHNWINTGTEPCIIAFILIDAKPVEVNGKRLDAVG